jgi:hypothetical protein
MAIIGPGRPFFKHGQGQRIAWANKEISALQRGPAGKIKAKLRRKGLAHERSLLPL